MNITLPRERQEWLEVQVEAGAYDSVEEAVASILAERMNLEFDDMAWAQSLVQEGRTSAEREGTLSMADHLAGLDRTMEELKRR